MFLDLQKLYNTLYRDRCLKILAGYGVVLWTLRILRTYWTQLQLVARAGGYFAPSLQGYFGVTQADTFPPIIFNVVVDAVIRPWLMVVAPTEAGADGLRETIQELEAFF